MAHILTSISESVSFEGIHEKDAESRIILNEPVHKISNNVTF